MNASAIEMSESGRSQPTKSLLILVGSSFFFWLVLVVPAWLVADVRGIVGLSVAAVMCLLPGVIALGCKSWLANTQGGFVLVASGLRLGVVLAGVLTAKSAWPDLGPKEFFVWLVLFYLFVLAVETWLTVRRAV